MNKIDIKIKKQPIIIFEVNCVTEKFSLKKIYFPFSRPISHIQVT